jgi:hypothetical protein
MNSKLVLGAAALPILVLASIRCSNEGVRGGGSPSGSADAASSGGSSPTAGSSGGGTGGTGGGAAGTGGSAGQGGARDAARSSDAPRAADRSPETGGPPTAGSPSIDEFAGTRNNFGVAFKDSWMIFGCFSAAGQDCVTNRAGTACPNQNPQLPMEQQGLTSDEFFTVGGTAGQRYKVTISVTGVAEGKYYEQGMRAAGNAAPPNINGDDGIDGFYTGGRPVDRENYNIYKLSVRNPPANPNMPQSGTEVAHFYLNSMPSQFTQGEAHNTFAFKYSHDIEVPGGAVIQYHTADRNCRAVDNCGPGSRNTGCAVGDGRRIPGEPNLMIPATYQGQPVSGLNTRNGANQPFHAQLFHITVTAVAAM